MGGSHDTRPRHDRLLHQLAAGFDALYNKVEELLATNVQLERQIKEVQPQSQARDQTGTAHEVTSSHVRIDLRTPGVSISDKAANSVDEAAWWEKDPRILDALSARREIRCFTSSRTVYSTQATSNASCSRPAVPIEQDFTTQGAKGELKCPFASMISRKKREASLNVSIPNSQQRPDSLPTPPDLKEQLRRDPIAAEFHAAEFSSPPPSAHDSAPICPIRFLDKHSPEEVAEYFENHKHEIPRSHEVCVKRYQTNERSIRELDAKYGSLVHMIQGLGVKHQPLLPTKEDDEEDDGAVLDRQSLEKVERWAENCTENPEVQNDGPVTAASSTDDNVETRTSHFDMPLKEIRVGESPSRPWGISVPYVEGLASNSNVVEDEEFESPLLSQPMQGDKSFFIDPNDPSTGKFALSASNGKYSADIPQQPLPVEDPLVLPTEKKAAPQMLFTGPIFFGYSVEQASTLIQKFQQQASS